MAERRLIDVQELLNALEVWKKNDQYRKLRWPWERWVRAVGIYSLETVVKRMKPVDAVEVVRCKDCAYGKENLICANPHCSKSFYGCPVPSDHYCSYGERRTDEKV